MQEGFLEEEVFSSALKKEAKEDRSGKRVLQAGAQGKGSCRERTRWTIKGDREEVRVAAEWGQAVTRPLSTSAVWTGFKGHGEPQQSPEQEREDYKGKGWRQVTLALFCSAHLH